LDDARGHGWVLVKVGAVVIFKGGLDALAGVVRPRREKAGEDVRDQQDGPVVEIPGDMN